MINHIKLKSEKMKASPMNQKKNFQNKSLINQQINNQKPQLNLISGESVALINGLIESIKEYYQVSLSNNSDANNIFMFYNEEEKKIQNLLNEMINNNQYQKINELFDEINIANKIIVQLQDNSNSVLQNLNLFFEDAKLIIKKIREQRQRQLTGSSSNNSKTNLNEHIKASNLKQNGFNSIYMSQLNQVCNQILQSLNKFSDFNYIIEGYDAESATYYYNLQDFIKKDVNTLLSYIKKNRASQASLLTPELNGQRSKSLGKDINKEIERLKKLILAKDKTIKQLKAQFNNLKINYTEGNNINYQYSNTESNENSKIRELEKIISDKNIKLESLTNRLKSKRFDDIQNIINEKDNEIFNLQQQLNLYEQNEQKFSKQLDDLNSQFQSKSLQYEKQINFLKNNLAKYINNNQQLLQNDNFNMENNPGSRSDNNFNLNFNNNLEDIKNQYGIANNKNMSLTKMIKQQKNTIIKLQKEISTYKNQIEQYEQLNKRQIEEMNNNIYKNNKIIEQKDELIKKLREKIEIPNSQININMNNPSNNNEILLLKFENEKLQKEINLLKLSPKNNVLNNNNIASLYTNNFKELQQLNLKYIEENNSSKIKIAQMEKDIKQLMTNNEELKQLNNQQKNKITNLDLEISKKKEQIEGLQDFIVKLQAKLENSDSFVPKARSESKMQKKDETLFNGPNEKYTKKIENLLNLLNKANKDISLLQTKNKELQFKLEEKQAEEEISGFKTEDVNFSNYEEEFDLKKMINGAKDKNRSEDINIDYPGMQRVKDKNKELQQRMNMLIKQVKILISNINCNNSKIKPQISQLCQLMRIPAKSIPLVIAGKKKKQILGLVD